MRRRKQNRNEVKDMAEPVIQVVAALLRRGDRFLICQRPAHKARGLLWEFVGGKVEPGETKPLALIRECREELGISVQVHDVFMELTHVYPDITIHLTLFRASTDQTPQRLEHNDLRWITTDEITQYSFCPADADILERLQSQGLGPLPVSQVGVIGAGTMGAGIAQTFAQAGYTVFLCDRTAQQAEQARQCIASALQTRAAAGKLSSEEEAAILGRITTGTADICRSCGMVIEAVYESLNEKKRVFRQLQEVCPKDCIFCTNTSSLSITEIAEGLDRPVVGMHFFNPAPVMQLVEVIAGQSTPSQTLRQVMDIAAALGKTPVAVHESPGFVVNRLLAPMINDAIGLLADGTASAEDIDTAMRLGAGHPMGPLALADLIGLDVVLAVLQTLQQSDGAGSGPHPLLCEMVREGRLGRKTGEGFYRYPADLHES